MDYRHSEVHKKLKENMEKFCREEIAPGAPFLDSCSRDEAVEKMKSNVKKLAAEGYLELLAGDDFTGKAVAGEELAKACPATFLAALSSLTAFGRTVKLLGTDGRQQKIVASLTTGESIGAVAFTEGNAGSDMSLMRTVAERRENGWVLNGTKDLVTNAPIADVFLVLAWTDQSASLEKGTTLFLIARNTEGLSVGDHAETMGLRGAVTAGITFRNCFLGDDAVLGGTAGLGWVQLQRIMDEIRIALSVLCVGIGVSCMEDSTKHAKEKKAFGKPIGLFEGVGAKLATMYTLNDIGRMLVYRACWAMETGDPERSVLTSCAKLFTSEGVEQVSSMGMQINGGHGYLKGSVAERLYRDARFAALAYGTSEMQRSFIAKDTLDRFRAT
jgi:alkylation response protein AidB-like acyl-CoA dehydrogenase